MKKLAVLSTLTITGFMALGCGQLKTQMKHKPSDEMSQLFESVKIDDKEIFDTPNEYTHEMAEATAEDNDIKNTVGSAEIDEELPGSESDTVPYKRNFLLQKNTKRMQFWVDYFTKKNRDRFQRFINNGEEYRHIIEETFEAHGLPKELYYVGLIESGYYLGARSHASAVGPWQFIKGTGSRYGLKISHEIDERQDLFKASRAAAMYFKDLHNVFSSWELALAAYNAGEYGIIRRIMKHGTRDFYELSRNKQLPSETINYVPKVLAAMHVVENAKKYGFHIPKNKNRLFDRTELKPIKKNVSLNVVANRLNVDVKLLKKLNPELKGNSTPRNFAGTYMLRVPQSRYAYKLQNLEAPVVAAAAPEAVTISKPESKKELMRRTASVEVRSTPKTYKVKRGDTLISISRKFKVTPRSLAENNGLNSWRSQVRIGQVLKLEANEERVATAQAAPQRKVAAAAPKVKLTNKPIVYKVKPGDNLTDIAKVFSSDVSSLKVANNLKRGKIIVGQKIILPNTKKGIYTVKKGDHLTKVAKEFNQDLNVLIKLNSLKRGNIYPGQKIIVNMD